MIRYNINKLANCSWDIVPIADSTYEIGSSTKRFKKLYSDAIDNQANIVNGGLIDNSYGQVIGLSLLPLEQLFFPLAYSRSQTLPEMYFTEGTPDVFKVVDMDNNEYTVTMV